MQCLGTNKTDGKQCARPASAGKLKCAIHRYQRYNYGSADARRLYGPDKESTDKGKAKVKIETPTSPARPRSTKSTDRGGLYVISSSDDSPSTPKSKRKTSMEDMNAKLDRLFIGQASQKQSLDHLSTESNKMRDNHNNMVKYTKHMNKQVEKTEKDLKRAKAVM